MKFIYLMILAAGCTTNYTSSIDEQINQAPLCEGYVSKKNCDDGDSTLFSGLLCLSGIDAGCDTVKASQDSSGRFWRSPRRIGDNLGKPNSFSRDMALGVLAYLIKTKDTDSANAWIRWIDHNRPCLLKIGRSCKYRGLHRYCKADNDHRCTITPAMFQLMYYTWEYIGLEPY